MRRVTGSSPVSSTKQNSRSHAVSGGFLLLFSIVYPFIYILQVKLVTAANVDPVPAAAGPSPILLTKPLKAAKLWEVSVKADRSS